MSNPSEAIVTDPSETSSKCTAAVITVTIKHVDGRSISAYNLFWNNGVSGNEHEQGSNLDYPNTLFADPLIDRDFHLQAGSPAIDADIFFFHWQNAIVLNIPGTEFYGAAPDLGVYEKNLWPPLNTAPTADNSAPVDVSRFSEGDAITLNGQGFGHA